MGFQNTAQNLASYGRGNDTELVHMTPGEVKGLQALALAHGGSLTINPDTGLVEAGFLERILPMVAGAGLTMIPGVGPLAAAAMVGGGYGLATGSVEKGLMAGLSAYGGAGLTTSLASVGSEVGRTAAEQAATEGFKTVGQEAVTAGSQEVAKEAAKTAATEGMALPANYADLYAKTGGAQEFTQQAAQSYINPTNFPGLSPEQISASQTGLPQAIKSGSTPEQYMASLGRASATQAAPAGVTASNLATGLKEVGTNLPAAGQFASNNIGVIASTALPFLIADQQNAGPGGYQEDEYDRRLKGYKLSPDYKAYEAPRPNPYYRPTYAAEGGVMESFDDEAGSDTVGMASGGIARYRNKGEVNVLQDYLDRQDREEAQKQKQLSTNPSSYFPNVGIFRDSDIDTAKKDALTASMIKLGKTGKGAGIKAIPLPKTAIKGLGDVRGATPEIEEAADGGIMRYNLGGYSDGGRMLKGPGDGMSDSIPASIAGKQPARLADGEFVVPADVVSHLGNGSTDAGAKKLYGMMDKIRKARTGRKKQAPQVNVDKYLPMNKKASGGIAGYAEGGTVGYAEGGVARYNDGGLASNIQAAYNAGYSGSQIGAALIASGVSPEAAAAATGLGADVIAQVYAGGAALTAGGGGIGAPEGPARNTTATPVTPTPVTPTPVTPAPVNKNTTGPGGYTIPFFPKEAIASYLKEHKVTTQPQIEQLKLIFNVNDAQIKEAQDLIVNNPTLVDATTAKYRADIAANPAQEAQNARDLQARVTQLGITPLIPIVPPPVTPTTPTTPTTPGATGVAAGSTVYRPSFVPRTSGITMSDAIKDPYSNQGLESLYSQMMGQYAKPAAPMSNAEVKALAEEAYKSGSGAEVGRALINKGIPVNQAISSLKSYAGLTPDIVNQAYIGGQSLGVAPPPTLNTQYNYSDPATYYRPPAPSNLILTKPIVDAAFTPTPANTGFFTAPSGQIFANEAAYNAANPAPAPVANKAGGLMSVDRKKRAKTKPKKGLLAA